MDDLQDGADDQVAQAEQDRASLPDGAQMLFFPAHETCPGHVIDAIGVVMWGHEQMLLRKAGQLTPDVH